MDTTKIKIETVISEDNKKSGITLQNLNTLQNGILLLMTGIVQNQRMI